MPTNMTNTISINVTSTMSVIGVATGKRGYAANNIALFTTTMNKLGPKAVPPKRQKGYNSYSTSTCTNIIVSELIGILLPIRKFCKLKMWLLFLTIQSNIEF